MFGNDKKVGNFDTTLISAKAEVVGDIKLTGGLHIDGQVTGNIIAEPGSGAVVRVSDKGVVKGEIRAPHIIINGKITGDVRSFEHVELAKKAEVQGDLYYTTMEMVMGARVNGKLKHTPDEKSSSKKLFGRTESAPTLESKQDAHTASDSGSGVTAKTQAGGSASANDLTAAKVSNN